ncbi:DMT family transporter [Leptothrix sp. BB-4]
MTAASSARASILFTVLATACWGIGTVLAKLAVSTTTNATQLLFHQLVAAMVVCGVFASGRIRWSNKERRLAWLGLLEPGLAYALGLYGLTSATALQAVMVQATEGFMIVGVAFVLFRKATPLRVLVYGCVAVVGVVLACEPVSMLADVDAETNGWGVVWIALGTLAAAFYVSFTASLVGDECDPVLLIFWQLVAATLATAVVAVFQGQGAELVMAPAPVALCSGVITYFLSFVLYIHGMRTVPVHISAFLLNLTPVFGITFSMIILGERLTYLGGVGFMMILGATILLSRSTTHG